ncbi:MAG: triose-phosphate isomerase [archaeon]|nr:triose-phosphate isomerase [archaeon]
MKPLVVVNVKTYESGTGAKALKLAKVIDIVAKEKNSRIIFCAQPADIHQIATLVKMPVYAQHIDPITYSPSTGSILPESVKAAGARGTLLNHAEKKIDHRILKKTIEIAKEKKLRTIVCADSVKEAGLIAHFAPDCIAVEPPELIGGNVSVSKARPQDIIKSVRAVKKVNPDIKILVGAGIKTSSDVRKSIELGADGVLIASGVVCAKYPKKIIESMVSLI